MTSMSPSVGACPLADDGQNVQQFMSDSPWSAATVIRQVHAAVAATPALRHGGGVLLDESADEKSRRQEHRGGAAAQWAAGQNRNEPGRRFSGLLQGSRVDLGRRRPTLRRHALSPRIHSAGAFAEFIRHAPSPRIHSAARSGTMAFCTGWVVTSAKPSPTIMLISLRTPKSAR